MDITDSMNLTLTNPIPSEHSNPLTEKSRLQREQFAKDFESVFMEKLLDEMKNTIGDWGFEHDGASRQILGLFWLNLARDVSSHGGLGLWKDIYDSLDTMDGQTNTPEAFDNTL